MIQVGNKLPHIYVKQMTDDGIKDVALDEICIGKKIAIFGFPGAFTPICTNEHLSSVVSKHAQLKEKGVDQIYCMTVNDIFVLEAWAKANNASKIMTMLSDGNGAAIEKLGLQFDLREYGMGVRSKRYSMLVDNCIVEQLFVEKSTSCTISSAENLLDHLS